MHYRSLTAKMSIMFFIGNGCSKALYNFHVKILLVDNILLSQQVATVLFGSQVEEVETAATYFDLTAICEPRPPNRK